MQGRSDSGASPLRFIFGTRIPAFVRGEDSDFVFASCLVLQFVRDHPGLRVEEVASATGLPSGALRASLAVLADAGLVDGLALAYGVAAPGGRAGVGAHDEGGPGLLEDARGRRVAWALLESRGATVEDIAERTGMKPAWVARCIHAFLRAGLAEATGPADARVVPAPALEAWALRRGRGRVLPAPARP